MFIGHSMTDKEKIRGIIKEKGAKIYFIGIGGISMSALAEASLDLGLRVFGSDVKFSDICNNLMQKGAIINFGHRKAQIHKTMPSLVVYSLAIGSENAEYQAARGLGILTVSRAEYLGALMSAYKFPIGVSGSHGKSTTTAMLHRIFSDAEQLPTVIGGAPLSNGNSYAAGGDETLIYESCEYGDSFLHFTPHIQIVLNIDYDHTDYFESIDTLKSSFLKSVNQAFGYVVLNADDENIKSLIPHIKPKTAVFSKNPGFKYRYSYTCATDGHYSFIIYKEEKILLSATLGVIGEFNVTNAVAAAIAADISGIDAAVIEHALLEFSGIPRRLEFLGRSEFGYDVFYDYAHHPKEIAATRKALFDRGYNNICAVFAPHTYTRTKSFFFDFARELSAFSSVYITDIYGAREAPIVGVTASGLAEAVRKNGACCMAISSDDLSFLSGNFDCVVLMGAGDISAIKEKIKFKKV